MALRSIFSRIGKLALSAGAPLLAAALPSGGIAVSLLRSAFPQMKDCEDPDELERRLESDPDLLVKLRQIEMENISQLRTLAFDTERLELERTRLELLDVASAREREVASIEATGGRDISLYVLAWVVVGGFFGLLCLLIFHPLEDKQTSYVSILFGALAAGLSQVLSYFFGSSTSSRKKDAQILAQSTMGSRR